MWVEPGRQCETFEFLDFRAVAVLIRKACRPRQLSNHRRQRAAHEVRRTRVAKAQRSLVDESVRHFVSEPGLANAGLARHQQRAAVARLGQLPKTSDLLQFGPPIHQRRQVRCTQRVKTALGAAFAKHAPRLHRIGEPFELVTSEIPVLEHAAAEALRLIRHDDGIRLPERLKTSRQIGRLADGGDRRAPFRRFARRSRGRVLEQVSDDDAAGSDADAHLDWRQRSVVLLDDVERSAYRSFGGVLLSVRVAKVCDHAVADVLGDQAVVA